VKVSQSYSQKYTATFFSGSLCIMACPIGQPPQMVRKWNVRSSVHDNYRVEIFTKLNDSVKEYGGNHVIWCQDISNQLKQSREQPEVFAV